MKYVGSVLILCACVCFSFFYEIKEKNKLENLKSMRDFINHIKIKIDYFLTPQPKLISEYKNDFIKELYKNEFKNLDKYYDKDICSVLKSFFKDLGKGLKDEEINLCSYTISKLDDKIKIFEQELPNKIKVVRTMIVFGGASIILLII